MGKCNFDNRTIFCRDNLDILRGINSSCIDLIYLDPPFNKKKVFSAPLGSSAEGASFKDWFREEDVKDEWVKDIEEDHPELHHFLSGVKFLGSHRHYLYNYCYLAYLAIRLIEMKRVLKDSGSIYLHCDPTMSHYIKILLDIVFGEDNFKNKIVWQRGTASGGKAGGSKCIPNHDVVFSYLKNKNNFFYHRQYIPYTAEYIKERFKHQDTAGRRYRLQLGHRKQYLDESLGKPVTDMWLDIYPVNPSAKERTGYPTQKPIALLERIIKASSNEGDVVFDPFCGCATTCVAAEKLGRKWLGIDVSYKAYDLVRERLKREIKGEEENGQVSLLDWDKEIVYTQVPPKRTDRGGEDKPKKYVYVGTTPRDESEGWYKVGIAKDLRSRLVSYQTGTRERSFEMKYELLTPFFREVEAYILRDWGKYEVEHEWVRGELDDIISKIKEMEAKFAEG